MRKLDLIGDRFGLLTVTSLASNLGIKTAWNCKCDCGNFTVVATSNLRSGQVQSCGCRERMTHGGSYTNTYKSWKAMNQRCHNPKDMHYKDYGGRGITVCARWYDFANFLTDMGERPAGTTLERKDNALGYSKRNCRWASRKEQSRNKRSNVVATYRGQTMCLADWAEHLGVHYNTVLYRMRKHGTPVG